jgi:ubiquinone biosynthesis protein
VEAIVDLGIARGRLDRSSLRRDVEQLFTQYSGKALGEIAIGPLLQSALAVVRHHHLQLPANLALLLKTIIMNEGMGARLDPDFRLPPVLAPYAKRLVFQQLIPSRVARQLSQASMGMVQLGAALPQQMRRIVGDLERGNLTVRLSPEDFEPLMRRFEQLANRIVLGIIAAAFITGLAVLLAVYHPPGIAQWAGLLFAVGFVAAGLFGLLQQGSCRCEARPACSSIPAN